MTGCGGCGGGDGGELHGEGVACARSNSSAMSSAAVMRAVDCCSRRRMPWAMAAIGALEDDGRSAPLRPPPPSPVALKFKKETGEGRVGACERCTEPQG